ncbi:MAG TPA: hypothetical protein VF111_07085, partial [Thermoanaerobaculia bacterium]
WPIEVTSSGSYSSDNIQHVSNESLLFQTEFVGTESDLCACTPADGENHLVYSQQMDVTAYALETGLTVPPAFDPMEGISFKGGLRAVAGKAVKGKVPAEIVRQTTAVKGAQSAQVLKMTYKNGKTGYHLTGVAADGKRFNTFINRKTYYKLKILSWFSKKALQHAVRKLLI